jgi:hypothetical protein
VSYGHISINTKLTLAFSSLLGVLFSASWVTGWLDQQFVLLVSYPLSLLQPFYSMQYSLQHQLIPSNSGIG